MRKRNYYQILGIGRNVTPQEIKKAYRKIALRYHPDKNPGDKSAEERFKEASMAYETLSDPEQRGIYDQSSGIDRKDQGLGGFKHPSDSSSSFSDLFDDLFKPRPQTGRRAQTKPHSDMKRKPGADMRTDLVIPFAEAMLGVEKTIQIRRNEACQNCKGTGARKGSLQSTCPKCLGSGKVAQQSPLGDPLRNQPCIRCQGTGDLIQKPCRTCRGTGAVGKERSLLVKIPPGLESGKSLRLPGQGECSVRGGRSGDLFIDIVVEPHPVLQRDGYDLQCQIPISFTRAALGGEIRVPTLHNSAVLYIPRGTQCNQIFRLKGLGGRKSENEYGDLFITVIIEVPRTLTRRQEQLLKEFTKLEDEISTWGL